MAKSTGAEKQEEAKEKDSLQPLTQDDMVAKAFLIDRIRLAKQQRDTAHEEFDGMTFEEDYIFNKRASNSWLRPKVNDDEVRANTGVTEKKLDVIANELNAINLQPEIRAFDQEDLEISGLGEEFQDIVKRTNIIEKDDDIYQEAIQELITQRCVFLEEIFDERTITDKKRTRVRIGAKNQSKFDKVKRTTRMAKKRLLTGIQVYLGDITIPAYRFQEQPYIVKYERKTYDEASTIYGEWENWKYVKPGMQGLEELGTYGESYRMNNLEQQEVEILKYESAIDDEYQIVINGIMMLAPGQPLPWEKLGYNTEMFALKSMGRHFAYGKPLTASSKFLQAIADENIRNLIRRMRQAIEPPLAVATDKGDSSIHPADMWEAGAVTYGLSADTFEKLIDHQGVTNSDLAMEELISGKIQEFIGASNLQQGITEKGLTATQAIEQLRQAMKQLGYAVSAMMRMKRDMTFLRIYNIIENYSQPIEVQFEDGKFSDTFQKFTADDATFEDEGNGKKIIQFMDRDLNPQEEDSIFEFEKEREDVGERVRFRTINIKKLRQILVNWYVVVVQTQREGSALDRVIFQDQLFQGVEIQNASGGAKMVNWDKASEMFERIHKAKGFFQKESPEQLGAGLLGAGQPTPAGIQMTGGAKTPATQQPSINSLLGGAR